MKTLTSTWICPSNIALIKYWGKKNGGPQLPANASLSLTLSDLFTKTLVVLMPKTASGKIAFQLIYNGEPKPEFEPKIKQYFDLIYDQFEIFRDHELHIHTVNNFPHGSGIASSAAGFGALSLCMVDLEMQYNSEWKGELFRDASFFARLGSGSACRSMYAKPAVWGYHPDFPGSSDEFAIPLDIPLHPHFQQLKDAVLIVDEGQKSVSSSQGHSLLSGHPFAESRFAEAHKNMGNLRTALLTGDWDAFIHIVELEALQLHAMMMVSTPYYFLMKPNTLAIIEKIWEFRRNTRKNLLFTLDAGANVHLLYEGSIEEDIQNFIKEELLLYCQNQMYLCSATGKAPEKIS